MHLTEHGQPGLGWRSVWVLPQMLDKQKYKRMRVLAPAELTNRRMTLGKEEGISNAPEAQGHQIESKHEEQRQSVA